MKLNGNMIWRNALLSWMILIGVTACASVSTTPPPVTNQYCSLASPIRYDSRLDRPETVAQIEKHNSVWVCLCEHDCPTAK
jgi:hypothetical protein